MFQSFFCWILVWKGVKDRVDNVLKLVSILFLLDSGLEVPWMVARAIRKLVSILFLLDSGLEASVKRTRSGTILRFNPFFAGFWFGRPGVFQYGYLAIMFQSFFCWILVWKKMPEEYKWQKLKVSILFLLDSGLEAQDVCDGVT